MAKITEVAPDLFRITTFLEPFNLQFSQFLVRDDQPLLFHTGPRVLFADVKKAVASLIDVRRLRWISFSHFEADECGSLPEWQQLAPQSDAVCSLVGKLVSVDDSWRFGRRRGWWTGRCCRRADTGFNFWRRRMCHIVGSRASCSKKPIGPSSVQICFTRRATVNR